MQSINLLILFLTHPVLPGYDLINGMSTDYLHCVLLGVCRLLLHLWLQSCHHQELWYIGGQLATLDDCLCSIKPPSEFQRTPRSMATKNVSARIYTIIIHLSLNRLYIYYTF